MSNTNRTIVRAVAALLAAGALAGGGYWTWQAMHRDTLPPGLMRGNGRIEAADIDVATRLPGRVRDLLVDEGDSVGAGQVLGHMDVQSLQAQRDEALARQRQAASAIDTALAQVTLRESDRRAVQALVSQRESDVDASARRLARSEALARDGASAEQELDEAMAEQQGQVRIAITPYITLGFLGQAFRWFRQRYPKVELELIEGLVSRALPRLRDGTLDLAIVADTGDLPAGEFQSETLLRERQHIVVRAGHPVLADPNPQALSQLEWLVTGPRDPLKPGLLRAMFEQVGAPGPSRIVFCDTLAGMTLLRETDVAGLMPEPLLRQPEGRGITAVAVPELESAEFHVRLLTREDVPQTPAAAYLAHCLHDACRAPGQACVS